jgi:hypothetical protein
VIKAVPAPVQVLSLYGVTAPPEVQDVPLYFQ